MMSQQDSSTQSYNQIYFQTIVQPGKKYQCCTCKRDTSSYTFISSKNSYYCIPCFVKLKKWTDYHVINKLEFPLLEQSWTALDEIYLFQGLQKHGFGNWNEIADYIQNNKTKQDVQRHYTQFYLNSPNFIPVSIPNIDQDQRKVILNKITNNTKPGKSKMQKKRQTFNSKRIKSINQQKSKSKKAGGVQIVGYMYLRKDFQYEYDNEAELLLAEMQFTDDDTQQQKQMKYNILELYNKRLTERNRKKQFIFSRGILDLEKQVKTQKILNKSQKQIYNMMKIFSRFHTSANHDALVKGIIRQKLLKQKIEQYKQLRRKGFVTKAQIQQQIFKKYENKNKKKSNYEFGFSFNNYSNNNRNNRRNPHTNGQIVPKKLNIYFSENQLQLLKNIKISGISYMMVKQTILRQYIKKGTIDRQAILTLFSLDKNVVNNIINFLKDNDQITCSC